jgi:hypothetical protein
MVEVEDIEWGTDTAKGLITVLYTVAIILFREIFGI